ncbi:MAG: hypothetical protein ABI142_06935, partial [Bryocella sp.]
LALCKVYVLEMVLSTIGALVDMPIELILGGHHSHVCFITQLQTCCSRHEAGRDASSEVFFSHQFHRYVVQSIVFNAAHTDIFWPSNVAYQNSCLLCMNATSARLKLEK